MNKELYLELRDEEWPFDYTDHDRNIVRAIVYDDEGFFYFVRADRDDIFAKAVVIETSGGGVEADEDLSEAIKRELLEELGAEVAFDRCAMSAKEILNIRERLNKMLKAKI